MQRAARSGGGGGGTPASPGKGVSEMEEAVPLGLRPPQSPARREGARRQAQRGLRPSPNLVIRPLGVVFLLEKTLIYCNLKNDRDVAGDPAAGAREREIFLFCGELGCSPRPHPAPWQGHPSPSVGCRQAPPRSRRPSSGAQPGGIYQKTLSF